MSRVGTAFRAFFSALGNGQTAEQLAAVLDRPALPAADVKPANVETPVEPPKPARSDAVTLLAALQRDARLLDFLMEPLDDYSDEQVGAAVRDVHRGSAQTIERFFAPAPLLADMNEGDSVSPDNHPPGVVRVLGSGSNVTLLHPGWKTGRCEIPEWTGPSEEADILMPAEAEAN